MFKFWIIIKSKPTEKIHKSRTISINRTDTKNNTTIFRKKLCSKMKFGRITDYQNTANFYKYKNVNKYKISSRIVIYIYIYMSIF